MRKKGRERGEGNFRIPKGRKGRVSESPALSYWHELAAQVTAEEIDSRDC